MTATLPAAVDSERAVLGGILLSPRAFADVAGIVTGAEFYHPANQAVFEAMEACDAAGSPIDPVSIHAAMEQADTAHRLRALGGEAYFATLTADAIVDALPWHARRIRAKADRRRWIETVEQIRAAGYGSEDDAEFFDHAERSVAALSLRGADVEYRHIKAVLREAYRHVEERAKRKQAVTGVPSGFELLDEQTGGFQPGQLIVIGGRPKMGKTALAMATVENAGLGRNCNGVVVPSMVFSLEMVDEELGTRMVSSSGGIEGARLRNGLLEQGDWIKFVRSAGELSEAPIHVYDKPATFARIRSVARRWRMKETDPAKDALIVVDYLGLIASDARKDKGSNREQEIAAWSRGFKALAKELRVPVLLLAQLNRGVEARSDKRPMMSDLRESGAIEQDADLVLLVYRDEVYNAESQWRGIAEIIIAAGRHAPAGMVPLRFDGRYTRFSDCAAGDVPQPKPKTQQKRNQRPYSARYAVGREES